jgi:hypothetical protein
LLCLRGLAALHDGERFLIERYGLAVTPVLELVDPKPLDRSKMSLLLAGISESVEGYPALATSSVSACVNVMSDPSVIAAVTVAMVGGPRPDSPAGGENGATPSRSPATRICGSSGPSSGNCCGRIGTVCQALLEAGP